MGPWHQGSRGDVGLTQKTPYQSGTKDVHYKNMQQKKILVIEDSQELADSLEDMLSFKGYAALKSGNGKGGIALAIEEKPDLILLDLRLPDIDGFAVLRELRKDPWGKTARVLILTASDTNDDIPADLGITPDRILHKSQWGIDNIATRIEGELLNS